MASPRSIERRLEDLSESSEKHPDASLCQVLSAEEFVTVDQERSIVRLDGKLFHITDNMREILSNN